MKAIIVLENHNNPILYIRTTKTLGTTALAGKLRKDPRSRLRCDCDCHYSRHCDDRNYYCDHPLPHFLQLLQLHVFKWYKQHPLTAANLSKPPSLSYVPVAAACLRSCALWCAVMLPVLSRLAYSSNTLKVVSSASATADAC